MKRGHSRIHLVLSIMALVVALASILAGCGDEGADQDQVTSDTQDQVTSDTVDNAEDTFDAEEYFKGKTIRLIVGYSAGGGYDTNARLLAQYLEKYVPGNPSVMVENMPGAASVVAANYLYSKAEPDGLTIGTIDRGINIGLTTFLGLEGLEGDIREFEPLGSLSAASHILLVRSELGYENFEDLTTADETLNVGGTGPQSIPTVIVRMYKEFYGANFNIVAGYPGSSEALLALQQGELDAFSINQTKAAPVVEEGTVVPLVQVGERYYDDVPMAQEIAPDDISEALAEVLGNSQRAAYPYVLPPDTPPNVIRVLREAFMQAAQDPELQSEGEQIDLLISPISGDEVEQMIDNVFDLPPDTAQALKEIFPGG